MEAAAAASAVAAATHWLPEIYVFISIVINRSSRNKMIKVFPTTCPIETRGYHKDWGR